MAQTLHGCAGAGEDGRALLHATPSQTPIGVGEASQQTLPPTLRRLVLRASLLCSSTLAAAWLCSHSGASGASLRRASSSTDDFVALDQSSPGSLPGAFSSNASCTKYDKAKWSLCKKNCGRCFNAGGRSGKICNAGTMTGYLCPPEPQGGEAAYACMDWSFGSMAMQRAEQAFKMETGEDAFFGVGTFGVPEAVDPQQGLGACYRMEVEGVAKPIIAQSINTGSDVAGNQFDLQIGAGGAGIFNTCVGGASSMFPGGLHAWGCQYGGVDNRSACAALPTYPRDEAPMRAAGDTLPALCEYSWDQGVRLSGAGKASGLCKYNPTLRDVARVRCPPQLADITWFQRADDPTTYKATAAHRIKGFPNADSTCQTAAQPVGNSAFCLTRMMDCRKPSGAWVTNVHEDLMAPGRKVLQTCTADGYTRIDVQCGCFDCNC